MLLISVCVTMRHVDFKESETVAVSAKIRKRQQRARDRVRSENANMEVLKAIETMPPEYAADCKMWVRPPGPNDERPRVEWDIGAKTNALMEAHAKSYGVTLDEVLYEVGRQFCMKRPDIYWAMKNAKINISDN